MRLEMPGIETEPQVVGDDDYLQVFQAFPLSTYEENLALSMVLKSEASHNPIYVDYLYMAPCDSMRRIRSLG